MALSLQRFADIRASLSFYTYQSQGTLGYSLGHAQGIDHRDLDAVDTAAACLAFDWYRLNDCAHRTRYAHRDDIDHNPQASPVPDNGRVLRLVPFFKALQCLHYNCDGGKDSAQSLATLEKLIHDIAIALACSLPEYDGAGWPDANPGDHGLSDPL